VQRLRVCYAKRGQLRFTSHRDVARTFERALRRAGVPMAYSQGFSPHPKVSWVGAAPTGAASEAEYMEIQVVERVDPEALGRALGAALPPGLDVIEVVPAGPGSLAARIDACEWSIEVPGVSPELLRAAVDRLLSAARVDVERLTKDGRRTLDARAAIVTAEVCVPEAASRPAEVCVPAEAASRPAEVCVPAEAASRPAKVGAHRDDLDAFRNDGAVITPQSADWRLLSAPCGILVTVVRQTTPAVRPDDVLSALRIVAALVPSVPAKATRMAQGRLDECGRLADPFAPDRVAAAQVSAPSVGGQGMG
jgi:radical SAM-linked protein